MRRELAAIGAAVLVAAGLATAAAPAANAAPSQRATTELVVIAKLKSRHQESSRAYSFKQTLVMDKQEVGSSRVKCVRVSKKYFQCQGTYRFADGAIKVADRLKRGTRNPTLAIAKGTGVYSGATGEMHVQNLNRHTSRNTFELTQPDQRAVGG